MAMDDVRTIIGRDIHAVVACESQIDAYIERMYGRPSRRLPPAKHLPRAAARLPAADSDAVATLDQHRPVPPASLLADRSSDARSPLPSSASRVATPTEQSLPTAPTATRLSRRRSRRHLETRPEPRTQRLGHRQTSATDSTNREAELDTLTRMLAARTGALGQAASRAPEEDAADALSSLWPISSTATSEASETNGSSKARRSRRDHGRRLGSPSCW